MARKWGYVRVSSKDQNEARQIDEILPLVESKSFIMVEKQSGGDFERPRYQWLKEIMEAGDTLIVKSLDRLGRNYDQIRREWQELGDKGIFIQVIDMPLLNTEARDGNNLISKFTSDLVLQVLSFVAENELNSIRQRQREGIEAARRRGVPMGAPRKRPENWDALYASWKNNEITAAEASRQAGISRTTFYKLVKETEKQNLSPACQ